MAVPGDGRVEDIDTLKSKTAARNPTCATLPVYLLVIGAQHQADMDAAAVRRAIKPSDNPRTPHRNDFSQTRYTPSLLRNEMVPLDGVIVDAVQVFGSPGTVPTSSGYDITGNSPTVRGMRRCQPGSASRDSTLQSILDTTLLDIGPDLLA
jgi:hypothetical protein